MRTRLVDFDAVGWLKRAAKAAGAFAVVSACLVTFAQAETRTLKLYNTHTKERVSITFKKTAAICRMVCAKPTASCATGAVTK